MLTRLLHVGFKKVHIIEWNGVERIEYITTLWKGQGILSEWQRFAIHEEACRVVDIANLGHEDKILYIVDPPCVCVRFNNKQCDDANKALHFNGRRRRWRFPWPFLIVVIDYFSQSCLKIDIKCILSHFPRLCGVEALWRHRWFTSEIGLSHPRVFLYVAWPQMLRIIQI